MTKRPLRKFLKLPIQLEFALISGARDAEPVKGLTHGYYKYPARFSPAFVRSAIEAFTAPGDVCLDPHVGGGTTVVEALALGRHAVGVDISSLAEFVTLAKATVLTDREIRRLQIWSAELQEIIDLRLPSTRVTHYAELGYYKHLDHPKRWRLRKAIEQALASVALFKNQRLEMFGRCVILRSAQWALDNRKKLPSLFEFRKFLRQTAEEMLEGATDFRASVSRSSDKIPSVCVINRSAAGLEHDTRLAGWKAPRLVVTSPPYPGLHVLYHRWQVDGRKEAPLPFMIANKMDGAGSSHYTMGDRQYPGLQTYFDNIRGTMASVAALATEHTVIVQMLAFSEPSWQLSKYLETMQEAGLDEVFLSSLARKQDGRLWREVPGRRWYSDQRGVTPGSQEVVLFHVKRRPRVSRRVRITDQLPLV